MTLSADSPNLEESTGHPACESQIARIRPREPSPGIVFTPKAGATCADSDEPTASSAEGLAFENLLESAA